MARSLSLLNPLFLSDSRAALLLRGHASVRSLTIYSTTTTTSRTSTARLSLSCSLQLCFSVSLSLHLLSLSPPLPSFFLSLCPSLVCFRLRERRERRWFSASRPFFLLLLPLRLFFSEGRGKEGEEKFLLLFFFSVAYLDSFCLAEGSFVEKEEEEKKGGKKEDRIEKFLQTGR